MSKVSVNKIISKSSFNLYEYRGGMEHNLLHLNYARNTNQNYNFWILDR